YAFCAESSSTHPALHSFPTRRCSPAPRGSSRGRPRSASGRERAEGPPRARETGGPRSGERAGSPEHRAAPHTRDRRAPRGRPGAPSPRSGDGARPWASGCGRHRAARRLPSRAPTGTDRRTCPVRTTEAPCAPRVSATAVVARWPCSRWGRYPATRGRTRVTHADRGWRGWATGRSFRPYRYQTLRAIPRHTRGPPFGSLDFLVRRRSRASGPRRILAKRPSEDGRACPNSPPFTREMLGLLVVTSRRYERARPRLLGRRPRSNDGAPPCPVRLAEARQCWTVGANVRQFRGFTPCGASASPRMQSFVRARPRPIPPALARVAAPEIPIAPRNGFTAKVLEREPLTRRAGRSEAGRTPTAPASAPPST